MGAHVLKLLRGRAHALGASEKRGKRKFVSEAEARDLLKSPPAPAPEPAYAADEAREPERLERACEAWGLDAHASLALGVLAVLEDNHTTREIALSLSGDPSVAAMTPLLVAELAAQGDPGRRLAILETMLPGGALESLGLVMGDAKVGLGARCPIRLDPQIVDYLRGAPIEELWRDPTSVGRLLDEPADHDEVPLDDAAIQTLRAGLSAAARRRPEGLRTVIVGADGRIALQLVHMFAGAGGEPILVADVSTFGDDAAAIQRLKRLCRDARLHGALLYLDGLDAGLDPASLWAPVAMRTLDAFSGALLCAFRGKRPVLVDQLDCAVTISLPNVSTERQVRAMTQALGGGEAEEAVSSAVAPRYTMTQEVIDGLLYTYPSPRDSRRDRVLRRGG